MAKQRVHRQALAEAARPVAGAELEADPERLDGVGAAVDEADHGLRDHERDVALEAVVQPGAAVRERIAERRQVDPDLAVAQLDREDAQVVGPLVERAAGGDVEAGVVPVAGEDAVLERPAVEREAHVRAAVVDRADAVAVGEERERVPVHVRDERAEPADVVERRGALEGGGRGSHAASLGAACPAAHRPQGRTSLYDFRPMADRLRGLWDFSDLDGSEARLRAQLEREPDDAGRAEVLTAARARRRPARPLRRRRAAARRGREAGRRLGRRAGARRPRAWAPAPFRGGRSGAPRCPLFERAFYSAREAGEEFVAVDAAHMAAIATEGEGVTPGPGAASSSPRRPTSRGRLLARPL